MLPVTGEDGGEISLRLQHPAHLQQAQELAEVLRINLDTGSLFQHTINKVLLPSGVTLKMRKLLELQKHFQTLFTQLAHYT